MSKANKIIEEVGITNEKLLILNKRLEEFFTDKNGKNTMKLSISGGGYISFSPNTSWCTIEYAEAIRMAKWILEMLEE